MNHITVTKLSKRYGYQWIIKDFSAEFVQGKIYGIAGQNGSGKSTLIKMLSGHLTPSAGTIKYHFQNDINIHVLFQHVSLVAPYTDLINEFTLGEMFKFHQKFKPFYHPITFSEFENEIQLTGQKDKFLSQFSSGMKQKIQLALAIFSNTNLLLLDEPTSYLDSNAKSWFAETLIKYCGNKLVVIASNDQDDLALCQEIIQIDQK